MKGALSQLSALLKRRRRGLQSGVGILIATGITTVSGFALSVLLARGLGAEQFGLYSLVIGIVGLLLIPVQSGLPLVITREIARLRVDGSRSALWLFVRWASTVLLACMAITCAGVSVWLIGFGGAGTAVDAAFVVPMLLLIAFWSATNVLAATINGFERAFTSRIADAVIRPVGLLAIAAILLLVPSEEPRSASDVVLAHGAASVLAALVALWFAIGLLRKFDPKRSSKSDLTKEPSKASDNQSRVWLASTFTFALVGGVAVLNNRIDLIMVGAISELSQVAYYNVAMQLTALITISQIGVNAILAPKAARMFKTGDKGELGRLVALTCSVTGALGLATFLVLGLAGESVLEWAFGEGFGASYMPMILMAGAAVIAVASGPVALLLNMAGHERITLLVTAGTLAMKVALNLALIPKLGAQGAALSTAIAYCVLNVSLTVILWRKTGIRSGFMLLWPR